MRKHFAEHAAGGIVRGGSQHFFAGGIKIVNVNISQIPQPVVPRERAAGVVGGEQLMPIARIQPVGVGRPIVQSRGKHHEVRDGSGVNRFDGHGAIQHEVLADGRVPIADGAQGDHIAQAVCRHHYRPVGQAGDEICQMGAVRNALTTLVW